MEILSREAIEKWIIPCLPIGRRGFQTTVLLYSIVQAILYRLKTGCQWRLIPLKQFFGDAPFSWNSVYSYFNRWFKDGCWIKIWTHFLKENRRYLDLSCASLDGSHTPAKNGGEAVGYQGRKACKTTNSLFLCDNQGVFLAMSAPLDGRRHDLYEIARQFEELCAVLKAAGINLEGLFLNADAGLDAAELKQECSKKEIFLNVKPNPRNKGEESEPYSNGSFIFDALLYQSRTVIERANAWIDGFKALLVRFESRARNWEALHYIAFLVIFSRKIKNKNKV